MQESRENSGRSHDHVRTGMFCAGFCLLLALVFAVVHHFMNPGGKFLPDARPPGAVESKTL